VLANVNPGSASSTPGDFFAVGSRVVFAANHVQYGRELWSMTVSSWHNFATPLNVDGSPEANPISPLDAVLVINYLNAHSGGGAVPASAAIGPPFLDVDGDNFVSPIDAVTVINWLNAHPAAASAAGPASEGEGLPGAGDDNSGYKAANASSDDLVALIALDLSELSAGRRRRR
jgi:hypothetical protein